MLENAVFGSGHMWQGHSRRCHKLCWVSMLRRGISDELSGHLFKIKWVRSSGALISSASEANLTELIFITVNGLATCGHSDLGPFPEVLCSPKQS